MAEEELQFGCRGARLQETRIGRQHGERDGGEEGGHRVDQFSMLANPLNSSCLFVDVHQTIFDRHFSKVQCRIHSDAVGDFSQGPMPYSLRC